MPKIIGTISTSFTPKDNTTPITGTTIFVTEPIPPDRGKGESADHFFLSTAKLASLDFTPAVGMEVEILFNRFGKVATLKLEDVEVM